ncbi:MAG: DUF4864 domain-containing protein [Spirochaetaceae bacterium]|nr:MAG: DUF4864 domain-containing protein [Spirochaetaceae bacterium]
MVRRFLPLAGILSFSMLLLAGCLSSDLRDNQSALRRLGRQRPSAELAPQEVVRIQMEALKYNDEKNRGIEIVYRFASPSNKVNTGPLPRFISMIKGKAYRPMLNYNTVEYGQVQVMDDLAAQRVAITTEEGFMIVYIFVLSKQQDEDCSGCWMTDAVFIEAIQKVGESV